MDKAPGETKPLGSESALQGRQIHNEPLATQLSQLIRSRVSTIPQPQQQETAMSGDPSRSSSRSAPLSGSPCEPDERWPVADGGLGGFEAAAITARERLARLARTIETDVIPRLVQAHRPGSDAPATSAGINAAINAANLTESDLSAFVDSILLDDQATLTAGLDALRQRGVRIDALYLDLFAPAARQLGTMWEDDLCDFSTVTVALGRLQRLLREMSPSFGAEVEHPAHGRRALFVQPRDEQHSFGLSIVAEFFRRDGWDVLGGVGGAVADPAQKVRDEWVDVIGFSIGTDVRAQWLTASIKAARAAARNPGLVVLVGGPPFALNPDLCRQVGADGTASDGREAPLLAERLLSARVRHR